MENSSFSSRPTEFSTEIKEVVQQIESLTGSNGYQESSESVQLGKYEIRQVLSSSGQAIVLLGFDSDLQRQVVIKLYHERFHPTQHQRMLSEGQALACIDSPFVAKCLGAESFDNELGLVLEFVPGRPVRRLNSGQEKIDDAVKLIYEITLGVRAIHQAGLLHRDLKPTNIIVSENGKPKIIDLGLVRQLDQCSDNSSGTPAFMPPEIARLNEAAIDQRSDIFGLGAILYFMFTGQAPFEGDSFADSRQRAVDGIVTPVREIAPSMPHSLAKICMKCLRANPQDRYLNSQELIHALESYQSISKRRRVLIKSVAVIGALSTLVTAAVWFTSGPETNVKDIENLPNDVQHFFNLLSTGQLPKTRDDFDLQLDVTDILDPSNSSSFELVDSLLKLTEGHTIRATLSAGTNQPFELQGYSIEWNSESNELDTIRPLEIGANSTDLTPFCAPVTEYLLFVALPLGSNKPSDFDERQVDSKEIYRGVKSSAGSIQPVSQLIVPYQVRPNPNEESD